MIVGVDAGGTNFDVVLIEEDKIVNSAKKPSGSIQGLLSEVLSGEEEIDRVVVSTTLVLNEAVQERLPECSNILIPGPGLSPRLAFYGDENIVGKGCIDHRGRLTEEVSLEESPSNDVVAITAKFSTRNPKPEKELRSIGETVSLGQECGGRLGFPMRAATTVSNAKSKPVFKEFKNKIEDTVNYIGVDAPIYFLKGDGAMVSKDTVVSAPSHTLKSGPAASAVGLIALSGVQDAICIDIGGTTTDICVVKGGFLELKEGVETGELSTFYPGVVSLDLPIGGDTRVDENGLTDEREGNSVAFGGEYPTLTDALNVLGKCSIGDKEASKSAFSTLGDSEDIAFDVLDEFISRVDVKINELRSDEKIVVGGALAPYLAPEIGDKLGYDFVVPEKAEVAGAVGCAVARVSVRTSLHIDSAQGRKTVSSVGPETVEKIKKGKKFSEKEARDIAKTEAKEAAIEAGGELNEAEVLSFRKFNVVESSKVKGHIIDATAQIKPGIDRILV